MFVMMYNFISNEKQRFLKVDLVTCANLAFLSMTKQPSKAKRKLIVSEIKVIQKFLQK